MPAATKTRILILDDHALFREGLRRLLASENDLEVADTCGTVTEAMAALKRERVDLVLLDYDLGDSKGGEFLSQAREAGFGGRVLILTAGVPAHQLRDLLGMGAAGVAYKHSTPASLLQSIRRVIEGGAWLDQESLAAALGDAAGKGRANVSQLTEREKEVLRAILEGLSNKEIGARLNTSEGAVKSTLQQLFHKTGVRTRAQLVRVALEEFRGEL